MEQYNQSEEILLDKKKLTKSELDEKWQHFSKLYPKLYSLLITNDNFDMNMLKFICKNVDKHKILSDNEKFELEVDIGKKLANKYIYSQTSLPKPTKEQEEFIKEKLKEKLK
jgi:hypothetical protein